VSDKRRRLDSTIATIQQQYGSRAVRPARDLLQRARRDIPHIATGFAPLDAITGCHGVPLGALTLLTGPSTSGKATIAYKILASAQSPGADTALLDRESARDHSATLLAERNRHAEAQLAEQNRHREEIAFYRTITVAGVLALVVLLLGIALAFVSRRRHAASTVYILPDSSVEETGLPYTYPANVHRLTSSNASSTIRPRALLHSESHRG